MTFLKSKRVRNLIKDYLVIILGDFLLAYAVVAFFQPQNMVTGGVSGLGIIIAYYTAGWWVQIPVWVTNLAFNIPLFVIAGLVLKGESVVKSAFAAVFLSVAIFLVQFMPAPPDDIVLATIFGAICSGVGVGLVLRSSATTGGTTLAGSILHNTVFKHISVARVIFFLDASVIIAGFLVFGPGPSLYAIASIYISTKVMESVLEGMHFAKAAFIISEQTEVVAQHVLANLNRGATELRGRGMYTKQDKNVLICVVNTKELIQLKELVSEIDPTAFVIVADVREVLGEGFKPHN